MNRRQYTIRGISPILDEAARRRARQEGKSLNAVAIEALARGLDLGVKAREHTDLDSLIGTWVEDPAFDAAIAEFSRIDEEAWR